MADNNPAMPSEDEDFDAVHTGGPILADNFDDNKDDSNVEAPKPNTSSVKVITDDDEDENTQETEEAETSSADDSETEESQPADEPESQAEPEEEAEETSDESISDDSSNDEASEQDQPEEPAVDAEPSPSDSEPMAAATEPTPAITKEVSKNKPPKEPKTGGSGLARNLVDIVLMAAVVALSLSCWQLYNDRKDLNKQLSQAQANPQSIIQKQTQDLIDKVSKLYNLPKDETPTIANVTDADQARQQSAFFKDAQNGDKVLMYVKAGIAILYRPSTNKIVLVAPLTFSDTSSNSPTSTTPAGTTKTSTSQ